MNDTIRIRASQAVEGDVVVLEEYGIVQVAAVASTPDGQTVLGIVGAPDVTRPAGATIERFERVSEPTAVTGGKAHRTDRPRTDELAVGDVIEYDSGAREVVLAVGRTELIGALHYRHVTLSTAQNPDGIVCKLQTGARWDRLSEAAKAEAGYPVAEHDVPSEREPRETCTHGEPINGNCPPCDHTRRLAARDDDVTVLARMIHVAVFESDLRGGYLTPTSVGRLLRNAYPGMGDHQAARAIMRATEYRGRAFESGLRAL